MQSANYKINDKDSYAKNPKNKTNQDTNTQASNNQVISDSKTVKKNSNKYKNDENKELLKRKHKRVTSPKLPKNTEKKSKFFS